MNDETEGRSIATMALGYVTAMHHRRFDEANRIARDADDYGADALALALSALVESLVDGVAAITGDEFEDVWPAMCEVVARSQR